MFEILRPQFQADSLDSISVEKLKKEGIHGLIIDLDNTMTPWNDLEVGPKVAQWFEKVKSAGIQACVVSTTKVSGLIPSNEKR